MADDAGRPAPEELILFEKDAETKIATITVNRPDRLNAITVAARHRFSDLVHRANVDDQVKVLIAQPGEELRAKVEAAVRRCPRQALTLVNG